LNITDIELCSDEAGSCITEEVGVWQHGLAFSPRLILPHAILFDGTCAFAMSAKIYREAHLQICRRVVVSPAPGLQPAVIGHRRRAVGDWPMTNGAGEAWRIFFPNPEEPGST
jgi:hypothetical protein